MPSRRSEIKYQMLKLHRSGKHLKDMVAFFRIGAGASHEEYMGLKDQKVITSAQAKIQTLKRLTMTRQRAKVETITRMNESKLNKFGKEETIAKFVTGSHTLLPHNWERYGNLIKRTKRVNQPRPGSSRGKIGQTVVLGFEKLNKELDLLLNAIQGIQLKDKKLGNKIKGQITSYIKSIRITAKA